jgi:hypothetical protein
MRVEAEFSEIWLGITTLTVVGLLCQSSHHFKITLASYTHDGAKQGVPHSVANRLHMAALIEMCDFTTQTSPDTFRPVSTSLPIQSRPPIYHFCMYTALVSFTLRYGLRVNGRYPRSGIDHRYFLQTILIS